MAPLLLLVMLAAPPTPPPTSAALRPATPVSPVAAAAAKRVPAVIQADVIRYSWPTRKVRMEGKPFVTITREDMVLTCRRLVGDTDVAGDVARATCEGEVRLVRGTRTVTCERAQYDRDAARILCEGNPVLRDGETEARGKRLTYLLIPDEVLLEEAVQATVPAQQVEQVSKKPAPTKPAPTKPAAGGK